MRRRMCFRSPGEGFWGIDPEFYRSALRVLVAMGENSVRLFRPVLRSLTNWPNQFCEIATSEVRRGLHAGYEDENFLAERCWLCRCGDANGNDLRRTGPGDAGEHTACVGEAAAAASDGASSAVPGGRLDYAYGHRRWKHRAVGIWRGADPDVRCDEDACVQHRTGRTEQPRIHPGGRLGEGAGTAAA